MNTPLVKVTKLSKQVVTPAGVLTILDQIDFDINAGESLAIMGPSGSGKSTLLSLLAGLDIPSAGSVFLNGENLSAQDEDTRAIMRREHVGFVFQQFHLLPSFTALENVMLPLELKGIKNAANQAEQWLGRVGLSARLSHTPKQLSGGEQQRVAIARAFAANPSIIFADEPTGSLDTHTSNKISDLIFATQQTEGTTLVLVTHDEQLAKRCNRRILLEAGRVL